MSEQAAEPEYPDLDLQVAPTDPLQRYFAEINRTPLLTAAEEVELCKRIEAGVYASYLLTLQAETTTDLEPPDYEFIGLADKYRPIASDLELLAVDGETARQKMIQANLKLVVSIAKRYTNRGVDFLDLIQEGNIGLMHAVDKFDYAKGFKFSTYSSWWIRQAVSRGLAERGRAIRIPNHLTDEVNKLSRLDSQIFQETGQPAAIEKLAADLGITVEKAKLYRELTNNIISLDRQLTDGSQATLGEIIEDTNAVRPEESVLQDNLHERIHAALGQLTPREAKVITERYGLVTGEVSKLEQVGEELGLTRERIRQIQKKAEAQLRTIFKALGITALSD